MEALIIRKAALNLYLVLVLAVLLELFLIYIFYDHFTIVTVSMLAAVSLFPAWLFTYALRELIRKTPHLTFTKKALIFKDHDFYKWENIADFAFSIEEVSRDNAGSIYKNYITISLKDGTSAKIPVSHLDRTADEILYLLKQYKRESDDAKRFSEG